jgi:NitT/TauT family transport system substrate-binding protein
VVQQRTVRLGVLPAIGQAPLYLALERGYFQAEGIDLQWEPVQVTSEAIAHVGSGTLEAAVVTVGAAVLNSIARGVNSKIIAGNYGAPPSGDGSDRFLMRKDHYESGLTDASGLRGRRVAGNALGVYTEYAIDLAMRTAGMTVDDIEFTAIPFPDIPAAFANNAIDAAFLTEPMATRAIVQGSAVPIISGFSAGAQTTVVIAGPSLLSDPSLAEGFMRAYLRGLRDVNAEGITSQTAAIIEQYTRVPAAVIQQASPPYWDPEGRVNWDSLMDQQRFYLARGSATYGQPIDLLQRLSEDGPRRAALAALNR